MKTTIGLVMMLLLCSCSTNGNVQAENTSNLLVERPDSQIPKKIESFVMMKLGLSSTGSIQVIGTYRLTHDCKLGKKTDEVLHLIQQDLFGGRLFWSCLVNLTQEKVQVLYRCQNPDDFGTIITIDKEAS